MCHLWALQALQQGIRRQTSRIEQYSGWKRYLTAAHDAAKINVSQRANVILPRSGGALGAQCVERKQPPPQDTPAAHILYPKPLFLFPSEHPKPHSCLSCKSFDDSQCCCSPKSAYDPFIMSHHGVIGQKNQKMFKDGMWLFLLLVIKCKKKIMTQNFFSSV